MDVAKPRILLHIFPTFAVGGSQARFAQLVRLHGDRYRHNVVALNGDITMADQLPREAAVECLPRPSPSSPMFRSVQSARKLINEVKPDALVTYNWGSLDWWIAKRFFPALPHVHIEDGFGPDEKSRQLLRRVMMRRILLNEPRTQVVLPSQSLLKIAANEWALPKRLLHYIPNSVDWHRFAAPSRHSGDNSITIGTVATLRPEKNISRLIRLFNKLSLLRAEKRLLLKIVGGGPEYSMLQMIAANSSFGERITFVGPTTAPEVHMAQMDVFALTSDTEQMPLSILEAMASSLPIVSFDVGDVPQMVGDTNRTQASVPLSDDEGFIAQALRYIDDESLRISTGADNFEKVKSDYDENTMANAYAKLFG